MVWTEQSVRGWLEGYAWLGDSEYRQREIDCIMSQDGWQHIDAMADRFAGAQFEPGPAAFSEGQEFALSALYECHDGPHLLTCPHYRPDEPETDYCPEHQSSQAIVDTGETKGSDPYGINLLACGHAVACFGPNEPNVIVTFRKNLM